MIEILRALPKELPQLEIIFDSQNTSALIALKDKRLKNLLYIQVAIHYLMNEISILLH